MFDHCRVCKILEIEYLIIFVYLPTFNLVHDKDQTIPIPYAPITKLILLMAVLISLFEGLQDLDSLLYLQDFQCNFVVSTYHTNRLYPPSHVLSYHNIYYTYLDLFLLFPLLVSLLHINRLLKILTGSKL
jgi:fumarate reductase subunit D